MLRRVKHSAKAIRDWATRPRYRLEDVVVLTGAGRSGSTLLAETLCRAYQWDAVLEPLHLGRSPEARDFGFDWATCIPPDEDRPESAGYLREVFTGRRRSGWFEAGAAGRQILGFPRRRLLVKFVRANRMVGWLLRSLELRRLLFVIRHPCAVVASQIAMGQREGNTGWAAFQPPTDIQTGFDGWLPDAIVEKFGDVLRSLENTAQALAGTWALHNHLASQQWSPGKCHLISYERVVCEPAAVWTGLAKFLAMPADPLLNADMQRPSRVASPGLVMDDPRRQIGKWREQLPPRDVDRILEIAHAFGFTCFSHDPEPDAAGLAAAFGSQ